MKLTIDIPEKMYLNAKEDLLCGGDILVKAIKNGIPHGLITEQEPCEDNQREFIELVVEYINPDLCIYPEYRGKPYFSIKYRENGKYIVGFGSYKIEMISQWIKEYFIPSIQPKTDVLDKIRTEIEQMNNIDYVEPVTVDEVLKIIGKYKAESEE